MQAADAAHAAVHLNTASEEVASKSNGGRIKTNQTRRLPLAGGEKACEMIDCPPPPFPLPWGPKSCQRGVRELVSDSRGPLEPPESTLRRLQLAQDCLPRRLEGGSSKMARLQEHPTLDGVSIAPPVDPQGGLGARCRNGWRGRWRRRWRRKRRGGRGGDGQAPSKAQSPPLDYCAIQSRWPQNVQNGSRHAPRGLQDDRQGDLKRRSILMSFRCLKDIRVLTSRAFQSPMTARGGEGRAGGGGGGPE